MIGVLKWAACADVLFRVLQALHVHRQLWRRREPVVRGRIRRRTGAAQSRPWWLIWRGTRSCSGHGARASAALRYRPAGVSWPRAAMGSNRRGLADRERGHGAPALGVTTHL